MLHTKTWATGMRTRFHLVAPMLTKLIVLQTAKSQVAVEQLLRQCRAQQHRCQLPMELVRRSQARQTWI